MIRLIILVQITSLVFSFGVFAADTVASIDGYKLNNLELQAGINLLSSVVKTEKIDQKIKQNVATKLLNDKIIEKLAKKEDLDEDALIQIEMRSILVNAYIKKHYDIEAIAKENYQKTVDLVKDKKMYTFFHIMLKNEDDAISVYNAIKKNKHWKSEFAKIAKEKSLDTTTGKNGGLLSKINELKLPTDFVQNIQNQPTNTLLKPFKTTLGYHVAWIEKIDKTPIEPFEKIKELFITNAIQEQINNTVKAEVGNEKIQFELDSK